MLCGYDLVGVDILHPLSGLNQQSYRTVLMLPATGGRHTSLVTKAFPRTLRIACPSAAALTTTARRGEALSLLLTPAAWRMVDWCTIAGIHWCGPLFGDSGLFRC